MAKNQHSFSKRQRELKKARKAEEKRAARSARKDPPAADGEHAEDRPEGDEEIQEESA